jgi:hypothetical protein
MAKAKAKAKIAEDSRSLMVNLKNGADSDGLP